MVVDDRFPTYRGQTIFSSTTEKNEIWLMVLEKAFAKLYGSYEALGSRGALLSHALLALTGSPTGYSKLTSLAMSAAQKGDTERAFLCVLTLDTRIQKGVDKIRGMPSL